jgi:hypothetical protein
MRGSNRSPLPEGKPPPPHFEQETGWWIFTATCARISLRYSNIVGDCINNPRRAAVRF